jgi:hypothetical protein
MLFYICRMAANDHIATRPSRCPPSGIMGEPRRPELALFGSAQGSLVWLLGQR